MAEKPGYWDVHQCAWVGTKPTDVGIPVPDPAAEGLVRLTEVPEQRSDQDATLAAGTPD